MKNQLSTAVSLKKHKYQIQNCCVLYQQCKTSDKAALSPLATQLALHNTACTCSLGTFGGTELKIWILYGVPWSWTEKGNFDF